MTDHDFLSFPDQGRGELDVAISDLVEKARGVLLTQGRLRALLRANQAVVEQLELPVVLERIVAAAVELVDAQYGALGVLSPNGGLEQFINVGMTAEDIRAIGHLPEGHGLLGALIENPHPIRLAMISDDLRSSGFPAGHPPMGSFLGVPVRVRSEVYGNLYLSNQSSGEFSAEDEQLVTALAATAGVAIENARLFAETRRRQAWSAASAEITAALLSSDETDLIALVADRVAALAEADLVCIVGEADGTDRFVINTAIGDGAESVLGLRISNAEPSLASVLEARQPRLFADREFGPLTPDGDAIGPAMAIPLMSGGAAKGVLLVVRDRLGLPFISSDLEMAADFAGQASIAMELARARADRQTLALFEDRARIARDLHDHVIQQIFATGLEMQSIAGSAAPSLVTDRILVSVANLDTSISQIRTIIFALSARPIAQPTIRHRILDLVQELSAGFSTTPVVRFAGPVDFLVTDDLADDVAAVCREAITNVAKHAAASTISITLEIIEADVVFEVRDNGVGIRPGARRSGLRNLAQRAKSRSGTLTVHSLHPGTSVRWSIPISESAREA
ncbi:hypothetical protein B7R21_18800 [Subtercola boreus]|uniref:Histidine kinase n=1 Tax=Subtercola boreus TaxID=120213 RepID=A0A3E0VBH3_9MICO|nr:GAF domain-containing protein [Subtercola boreus]RFA06710.1 hypothetical protein B7R21_18800 [Subtercola boreus]